MPDALQHPKACLRKKAGESVPERSLVLDLIAVAYDHSDGKPYRVEPCRYVLDHATFGPGTLGLGRTGQRVLDHLLAQFARQ